MPRMGLPAALKKARTGRMLQEELAAALGVEQGTVSKWENGRAEPGLEQIAALEAALGLSRGHVLVLAGYVDGLSDVEQAALRDDDLDEITRELVLRAVRGGREQARRRPRAGGR